MLGDLLQSSIYRMLLRERFMNELKASVARAALDYVTDNGIIGVGTGSTVNYFIEELASMKHRIDACVASSLATEHRLRALGIPVIDLNATDDIVVYVDGADEVNGHHEMIKGGGGALTREKIVASVAKQFICIVDESKVVKKWGEFPVAIEVIPMARSFVARELVKLGGDPMYREGYVTDNGNIILDLYHLEIPSIQSMEESINRIPGVVENGLFGTRLADVVLVAHSKGVRVL